MRTFFTLFVILLWTSVSAQEPGKWAFPAKRDLFSPEALLDLSYLNEDMAGERGFVRLSEDGNGFVRGDGEPIRFWAVNSYVARKPIDEVREHARFLAKRGVNMVRFHGNLPETGREKSTPDMIDETKRDQIWKLVAAMKDEGIYVTLSFYYPHQIKPETARSWPTPRDSRGLTGLIYFDPLIQEAYKGWLRRIMIPENPYTGIALKDDPAVAIVQMQNEDSLLFWTLGQIRGREARLLGAEFGRFLQQKYGSLTAARSAWNGAAAPGPLDKMEDDWNAGVIALSGIWHLTGKARPGRAAARLRDQTEFLTTTMHAWHAEAARYLREEIGAPHLYNAGNWKTADPTVLDDLERYSYTAGDVIGVNRYVGSLHKGERRGWAIVKGDIYREDGVLKRPLDLHVTLKQPLGHPYLISETQWVPPMWRQSEGAPLTAAYQALNGVDISMWFATREVQWREPGSANGFLPSIGKWKVATPMQMGMFPAAALMFRQGLIDQVPPVVIERRGLDELWEGEVPLTAGRMGYDPNRDEGPGSGIRGANASVDPHVYLVGPVAVEFGEDAADYVKSDLDSFIDRRAQRVTSANRQISWDWGQGLVTLDAPRAQGVIGDLTTRGSFELHDITLTSSNTYATIIAVPLDQKPLDRSEKILVQMGTIARPNGWQSRPLETEDGPAREVMAFGRAPWMIDRLSASLTIRNPHLTTATALDPSGMPDGRLEVTRTDGGLTVPLPPDRLYVVLQ
ncbi:MAG: hypothetical protein AAGE80_08530 [Pseudomonadota bacterium]